MRALRWIRLPFVAVRTWHLRSSPCQPLSAPLPVLFPSPPRLLRHAIPFSRTDSSGNSIHCPHWLHAAIGAESDSALLLQGTGAPSPQAATRRERGVEGFSATLQTNPGIC
jgi:hypothetical protein